MASKVIVKMRTCGRTHVVIAKLREDGDVDIKITSDCEQASQFAERCTKVSLNYVTDFYGSKVNSKEIRGNLWIQCLLPIGVFDAAWIELGMISKSLCKKVGSDEIILSEFDSEE